MNELLRIKNKITFLHNHLVEGNGYAINGKIYEYTGFLPAVTGAEKSHKFTKDGKNLFLTREDLICLDLFDQINP